MSGRKVILAAVVFLAALCLSAVPARAAMYDLTGYISETAHINDAWFYNVHAAATGTGVIDSFVRINGKAVEQGYNTDGRPVQFDENTSPQFTRSLSLSDVPIVYLDGDPTPYREFLLDINQKNSSPLLALDDIEIFQTDAGDYTNYGDPSFGKLVYDLDAGPEDNWILLDYSLNTGSGSGDMFAYIPDSLFTWDLKYVTLYSHFGAGTTSEFPDNSNNDGFEEWAVRKAGTPPVVPVPGALLLGLLGLSAAGIRLRRFA
jgi:hypothetical protein